MRKTQRSFLHKSGGFFYKIEKMGNRNTSVLCHNLLAHPDLKT